MCIRDRPKATRAGYAFVGWFDQAAGGNKIASALDTAIPSDKQDSFSGTTLYADVYKRQG